MSTLILTILSGFFKSCVFDLPKVSEEWIPPKRFLLYLGAVFIYPVALIVALSVIITVVLISYPISYIYRIVN